MHIDTVSQVKSIVSPLNAQQQHNIFFMFGGELDWLAQ